MACTKDHDGEVPRTIEKLEDSQRGFWRHKCAGCAYVLGRNDAARTEENLREQVRKLRERVAELEAELARKGSAKP